MITIDGSKKSGSGTILRYAVSLATLLKEPITIYNIRAKRLKSGLRPQHLAAVRACAQMCGGTVEGAELGSRKIVFTPGDRIRGGYYRFDIGTAGSTTMLLLTVLPLAIKADRPCEIEVVGGCFQDFAPSAPHMHNVLFRVLSKMGIRARLDVLRWGYVPKGGGIVRCYVEPAGRIEPLDIPRQGDKRDFEFRGIAVASHLERKRVAERMRTACQFALGNRGYRAKIVEVNDKTALQPGAGLCVWAENENCVLGMDRAGAIGRMAEKIGAYVAKNLLRDIDTGATVDRFTADQLVLYCALADGESAYKVPRVTEHLDANLWLVKELLGAEYTISKKRVVRIGGHAV